MRRLAIADLPALAGRPLGRSAWTVVDQPAIDRFAEATGDRQWIHVDVPRARAELGGTIAHGYLTLALLPRLASEIVAVAGVARRVNYGLERVRFPAPVPAGARVRLALAVHAATREPGRWRLVQDATLELEGSERPACVARTITLLYPSVDAP